MIKDFNIKLVIKLLSIFLLVESMLMLIAAFVSFAYQEVTSSNILISFFVTFFVALAAFILTKDETKRMSSRESYFFVVSLWILMSLFGALPFLLSKILPYFVDAFFESMSGFTTTGSSVLVQIESLPHGLLFWRSAMQWFGGISYIIISLLLLSALTMSGVRRFSNENFSYHSNKLHSRMRYSIIWISCVYALLTAIEVVALKFAGMSLFDAVCHSFSTISTGGFSTKTANIGYYHSPAVEYILIVFMFLAGINFSLYFFLLKGRFEKVFKNSGFLYYISLVFLFSLVIILGLYFAMDESISDAIRGGLFQVTSILSTTGFYVTDFMMWKPMFTIIIFVLMFFGASYGSPSGGIKMVRIVLVLKNSINELKHFMHPNSVSMVRYNNKLIPLPIVNNAFLFILLYVFMCIIGILFINLLDVDFSDSVRIVLTSIGNIGCGTGHFTAFGGFATLPVIGKSFLILLMLIGRLELYAFFILFTRTFWRR